MTLIGLASLVLAVVYGLISVTALLLWRWSRRRGVAEASAPVTILKPLCGAESGLYEDLKSFCVQDYAEFQVVFGVCDAADPARAVAERLKAEFPLLSIEVVVDPTLHGHNRKVSNLINMLPFAKHEILTISDSDCLVTPRYLAAVTAPLGETGVGLVTCIYQGRPNSSIWSRLGAMYVNEWYMPSVILAWAFGFRAYVSGQTMCLTQQTLRRVGGLERIANHLADDYCLGAMVRESGQRVVLSPYVVTGMHDEPSLAAIARHEIRWMRTLATVRPRSFRGLFLSFSLPLAFLGFVVANDPALSAPLRALLAVAVFARLVVHFLHRLNGTRPLLVDLWLVPLRDLLLGGVWLTSFFTARIRWRGADFDVTPDGILRRV